MTVTPTQKGWLARAWDKLKAVQQRLAVALTVALLFVVYWTVVAVVAIAARLAGRDLLHTQQPEAGSHWLRREPIDKTLANYRQQF